MKQQKLKAQFNEQVRNNGDVLLAISKATKTSIGRVRNWFYEDYKSLTDYTVLKIIANAVGVMDVSELLEDVPETTAA